MRTFTAALLILLATPHAIRAEVPERGDEGGSHRLLTLPEALRIFAERGFDLLIAQASVEGALADVTSAAAIANPAFSAAAGRSFGYDPSQCPGCSATAISLGLSDQAALFTALSGKRRLRVDVARAALAAAQRTRDDARRTLGFLLKQQYFQATLARAQRDFAREILESSRRTRDLNQRKFDAGAISEADLAKAQVAALEAEQVLDQAEQAYAAARIQIAFLLAEPAPAPEFDVDPTALDFRLLASLASASPETLLPIALETRPDLLASEAQVRRTETALALARRQRFPDVSLGITYSQEGSGQNAISPPTLTLGLLFPLPVFYLQQGEIRRAEADLRAQTFTRSKLRVQVASDVRTAFGSFRTSRQLVERMQGRLLERARRTRDLVQVQFEKGAATLLELLDAQRTYIAIHGEYLQNLTSYWTAVAQLEQAVGKDL